MRERGRADEVGEQHRQLPPFGLGRPRDGAGGSRRCELGAAGRGARQRRFFLQAGEGGKQPAAVADKGHTEVFQVLCGQARQNPGVDVVVAECLLILAQAQAAQPSPDLHPRVLLLGRAYRCRPS